MIFELNGQQIEARKQTMDFITNYLEKNTNRIEHEGNINSQDTEELQDSGVWELVLAGSSEWVTKVTVLNELAKVSPSIACMFSDLILSQVLLSNRNPAAFYATAFVEEDAGSDLTRIQTEVRKDNDSLIISGEKWFVMNANLAESFLVLARSNDQSFQLLEVAKNADGVIIQEQKKVGLEGLTFSKLILNNVAVPSSALVQTVDESLEPLKQAEMYTKLAVSALAVGISEAALVESLNRARTREQFDNPIGEYQAIQYKIAETTVGINAAKTLLYNAAQKIDRDEFAQTEAAMAKVYSSEVARKAVNHAVQIFGTHGLLSDSNVSLLYRSQRLTEIIGQTSEIQRFEIAKFVINHIGVNKEETNYGLSI